MKKIRCPKCNSYTIFDETRYEPGQRLVFVCEQCNKQFAIRINPERQVARNMGTVIVVENAFHFRQEIPLEMGDNVFGRFVRGTGINKPIETVDPSVDTRHCIIRVQRAGDGELEYILRDAPSGTGTFYMNQILRNQDRIRLADGAVITIGATTLILKATPSDPQ